MADGGLGGLIDETSGERGFDDWGFEVIKYAGFLLSHGAQFVYTADDAFNPSVDPKHPGLVFPLPGPGMFANMMKTLMFPHGRHAVSCVGKGGKAGATYMMERARQMLIAQGHSGDPSRIMMVGDRYDTDVRAGLAVGFQTCLVLTGCHTLRCQQYYRAEAAHFYAPGVLGLVPSTEASTEAASQSDVAAVAGAGPLLSATGEEASPLENPAEMLQLWLLRQNGSLQRGSAEHTRTTLRATLRAIFDAIDKDGSGTIDAVELLHAFGPLSTRLGAMDGDDASAGLPPRPAAQMPPGVASLLEAHDSSALCLLRALARKQQQQPPPPPPPQQPPPQQPPPLLAAAACQIETVGADDTAPAMDVEAIAPAPAHGLTFEEFSIVVEEGLAECGVEARNQWKTVHKKLSVLRMATLAFKDAKSEERL